MIERILAVLIGAVVIALTVTFLINAKFSGSSEPEANTPTLAQTAPTAANLSANTAMLRREDDGHYWARADIDGTSIKLLVDTGASIVALTWRDAQRLRLKPEELDFKWGINTANGQTQGASVLIPSIRVGNVEIENVEAMVLKDGLLENSLLGMSFLGKLYSYEFKQNQLIIQE